MHIATQGLVLRETQYKEADKILTVLTREGGKRTVKARGCRRKGSRVAASAQLLVWSDMTLFEYQDYYTLSEASSIEQFWAVRSDLELLALGSYFAEVSETAAAEGRPEPELLSLLLNSLYALDQLKKPPSLVKAVFELRLACVAGYEPLLDACAVCGAPEPENARFHLSDGVLHCARCRGETGRGASLPLDGAVLTALRGIVAAHPRRIFSFEIEPEILARLGEVSEGFLLTQLERGFHTLDYYKSVALPAR